jgi:pSer/pThr/pTyr-binding forkhead associated (FHA) protein
VLRDNAASAHHASIRYKDGCFFLIDLDSTSGTRLNEGEPPIARETLKDNDIIRIGELTLKFKCL